MTTGKKPEKQGKPGVEFLNLDLTKGHREALKKWIEDGIDLWDCIDKSIDSGLKFACGFDAYNDCIMASLTKFPDNNRTGVTQVLVGRGPDLLKAIQALFFKYEVVLQRDFQAAEKVNPRGITDWS